MPSKPKHSSEPLDFGTSELSKRQVVIPRLTRGSFGWNAWVEDESEIDRLLLKDLITASDHATLENFLLLLRKGNFVGYKSPSYEAPVCADPSRVGDRRAAQIRTVVRVFRRMDDVMGKGRRVSLINLVLLDRKWPGNINSLRQAIGDLSRILSR